MVIVFQPKEVNHPPIRGVAVEQLEGFLLLPRDFRLAGGKVVRSKGGPAVFGQKLNRVLTGPRRDQAVELLAGEKILAPRLEPGADIQVIGVAVVHFDHAPSGKSSALTSKAIDSASIRTDTSRAQLSSILPRRTTTPPGMGAQSSARVTSLP